MKAKKEIVIYCGERVGHFGEIFQLFKTKKGKAMHFKGIKRVWVGDCYVVTDGTMKINPESVDGFAMGMEDANEAEAQREVVRHARAEKKKAMELKKPNAKIVAAIKLLRPFYRSMNHIDQRRFTQYLQNEMSKPGGRK